MNDIYRQIKSLVEDSDKILVVSHRDPDGDSLGSSLAFARYLDSLKKDIKVFSTGGIPEKYMTLPDIDRISGMDDFKPGEEFDLVVVLECPRPDRIGGAEKFIGDKTKVINIDHHPDNENFGDIKMIDDKASSVGEMLTEMFLEIGFDIDTTTATLLYAAILTDTGRFRYNSTTRKTMETAGKLIDLGVKPRQICDSIYFSLSVPTMKLTGKVFSEAELYEDNRICLITLDYETIKSNGFRLADTEGMAEFTLFCRDVKIGAFLREIEDGTTKVSLRSRELINVSRIAHKFGGGGHHNAAGCVIDLPLDKAREAILENLREIVDAPI